MYESILRSMIQSCQKASEEIMRIYRRGFHVENKEDLSPVTDADIASNAIIHDTLSTYSDIYYMSEEEEDNKERLSKDALFIVDPLDGTTDFVNRDDSFGINLAFVVNHQPVLSVIAVPARGVYAYAIAGKGSYYVFADREEKMQVSSNTKDLILLASMTHQLPSEEEVAHRHKDLVKEVIRKGACTKALYLARGKADACIRYTPYTKEWDVCAPDLIVKEAGGIFVDKNLKPFTYNREDVYNRDGYCMFNRKENFILLQ